MRELFLMPEIQSFDTFVDFSKSHSIGAGDIIIAGRSFLKRFGNEIPVETVALCLEDYGAGEPTDIQFEAIQKDVRKAEYKRMVAIGGGSVIDVAKALCVADGRNMDQLFEEEPSKLTRKMTLILVPTTCGTGSEVTVTAVFDRTRLGTKMGLTNNALGGDYAVLIPELLSTLPATIFGTSSIDALIHGIESFLNIEQGTVGSRVFAEKSIRMIIEIYLAIEKEGEGARNKHLLNMQIASTFAGIAIANALPSASHAMGYPFAGKFHRPHGEACYVFLDATLKKYLADVRSRKVNDEQLSIWNSFIGILSDALEIHNSSDEAILERLNSLMGLITEKKSLKEYGATQKDCEGFGRDCYLKQQRLLGCAFTKFSEEELIDTFLSVW